MKRVSVNPINNKKYYFKNNLSDQENIDSFLSNNKDKKVIVVQGLGFVGAVMSLVCANSKKEDYAVIGVDLLNENNFWKIKSINEGDFPIVSSDPKIYRYYNNSKKKKNFYATYDSYAYSKADIIIVDINLDVNKKNNFKGKSKNFSVNLNPFKNAIKTIGQKCKEDILIIVETTVPPGTCQEIVYPEIKNALQKRKLPTNNFMIGHSYERVMPGPNYIDSIKNFYRVYSGIDNKSSTKTKEFLKTIISTDKFPLTKLANTNATEMAKVLENSYRAMNIAFSVEWSRFAESANINLYEVINAIRMRPTHSNLMYPGIGVGGYCLTKDPLLASWSYQNIFNGKSELEQSEKGVKINDLMPYYAYKFLKKKINKKIKKSNVLLMGISYRSDVGDTRYSPVENLYNYLKEDNCNIIIHDPYVSFWEEKKIKTDSSLKNVFKNDLDIIIISTLHSEYKGSKNLINLIMKKNNIFILDTVGVFTNSEISLIKKNNNIKVIGRGDI